MDLLKRIWNSLIREFFAVDPKLLAGVKLSENEVGEIAMSRGKSKDWTSEEMRPPHLTVENGKLVWKILFNMLDEDGIAYQRRRLLYKH